MITEDYVSFDTAKLLKEKGFNEQLDTVYSEYGELHKVFDKEFYESTNSFITLSNSNYNDITRAKYGFFVTAPTLQMAIKWLKEEHNLGVIPHWSQVSGEFGCHIYDLTKKGSQEYHSIRGSFDGFEEPAELGIKYCLENLI